MFRILLATFWQTFMVDRLVCPVLIGLLSRECWFHQLPQRQCGACELWAVVVCELWAVVVCKLLSENIVLIMPTARRFQLRCPCANMRRQRRWSWVSLGHRYGSLEWYPAATKRPWTMRTTPGHPVRLISFTRILDSWEKTFPPQDTLKGTIFFWCDFLQ